MIILNLMIRENGKIKEIRAFKSQSRLMNFIKIIVGEEIQEEVEFNYENITDLICDNPEIFKGTKYEGTRLYISEIAD